MSSGCFHHTMDEPAPRLVVDEQFLADTSAWSKARNARQLADAFNDAARQGLIATCDVVALELLRSAQSSDRYTRQDEHLTNMRQCEVGTFEVARARDVQRLLAAAGHHHGVKPADLLIAAAAESAGLPVLHYDRDYDLISAVTGQPCRWLAPRGTLP